MKCAKTWMKLPVVLATLLGLTKATQAGKVGVYSQTVNGIPWPYILYKEVITSADGNSWYPRYEASIGTGNFGAVTFTYTWLESVFGTRTIDLTIPSRLNLPDTVGSGTCPVTSIAPEAFDQSRGIRSVTIPNSVTNIGDWAFYHSYDLRNVSIGTGVTSIGDSAFSVCTNLTYIGVAAGNPAYASVNGLLLTKDGKTLVAGHNGSVTIPYGVTTIGAHAFDGCENLTSLRIPDSVTSIGSYAFFGCSGVTTLHVPSSWKNGNNLVSYTWFTTNCTVIYDDPMLALGEESRTLKADAASGMELPVTANTAWSAKSSASWLTVSPASGAENGTIIYNVDANTGTSSRTATITVTGGGITRTFTVTQKVWEAELELSAAFQQFTADEANGQKLGVEANVAWSAGSSAAWLVLHTASGSGNGTIVYDVAANTGMTERTAGITVTGGGVSRLFAVSQAQPKQTVTFMGNGGTPETQTGTFGIGAAYGNLPTVSRDGYAFAGWWTAASGGMQITGDSKVTTDGTRTFYARWTQTVTFRGNGGEPEMQTVSFIIGETYGSFPTATRAGYSFAGWWTASIDGTQVTTDSPVTTDATRTLYAHWTANSYAVTLDRQGGTGGAGAVTAIYGSAMPGISIPTRVGYAFGGYFTEADGGGTQYYSATGQGTREWDQTTTATLYARWIIPCVVTLDRQGGTGGEGTVTATYGCAMPTVEVPTREGFVFGGYYAAKNGGGTQYYTAAGKSVRVWDLRTAATLYAKWMAVNPNLSIAPPMRQFAKEGGTFSIATSGSGTWEAAASESWIVLSSTSGTAGKPVTYTVDRTTMVEERTGTVFVSGRSHTVIQTVAVAALSANGYEFEAAGESFEVRVSVPDILQWQIQNTNVWLEVAGATSRTGPGTVTLTASPNSSAQPRGGMVTIALKPFKVTQKARGVEVDSKAKLFGTDGGFDSISVQADGETPWTAESSDPVWITIFQGGAGTGSGIVEYVVMPQAGDGEVRTGTITVGNKMVYITQRGYDLGLSPSGSKVEGTSGAGEFGVSTESGNEWRAIATEPWITLNNGDSTMTGSGTVRFSYAENDTGKPRTGTIVVAGEAYTLEQQVRNLEAFPSARSIADVSAALEGAADTRLMTRVKTVAAYDDFRNWVSEAGLDPWTAMMSAHAWPSYLLGAGALFANEPEIVLGGVTVERKATGPVVGVTVTVKDGGSAVAVDTGKVAGLFQCTGDLGDWTGAAVMNPAVTPQKGEGTTMHFEIVPGNGTTGGAFLRIGEPGD